MLCCPYYTWLNLTVLQINSTLISCSLSLSLQVHWIFIFSLCISFLKGASLAWWEQPSQWNTKTPRRSGRTLHACCSGVRSRGDLALTPCGHWGLPGDFKENLHFRRLLQAELWVSQPNVCCHRSVHEWTVCRRKCLPWGCTACSSYFQNSQKQ